jgi:hypothetical protein
MMGADQLTLYKPQWPLNAFTVGAFGRFGAKRTNAKEGACGTQGYPCTHWGADLMAPEGSRVFVPFTGWLLYYGPAEKAPFVGYGPWVALIAHADREVSLASRIWDRLTGPLLNPHGTGTSPLHPGLIDLTDLPDAVVSARYTLLGHLAPPEGVEHSGEVAPHGWVPDPTKVPRPVPLAADVWDASKPKPKADHWRPVKDAPQNVLMMTGADVWDSPARAVFAGQPLGTVSNKNHVHWELRTAPIKPAAGSGGNWRLDPINTFHLGYDVPLLQGVAPPAPVQEGPNESASGSGGGGLLLLGAALMLGGKKRRGRRR